MVSQNSDNNKNSKRVWRKELKKKQASVADNSWKGLDHDIEKDPNAVHPSPETKQRTGVHRGRK